MHEWFFDQSNYTSLDKIQEYMIEMSKSLNVNESLRILDLSEIPSHGGTTLSSGVLPKWDDLVDLLFIKACGFIQMVNGNMMRRMSLYFTIYLKTQV